MKRLFIGCCILLFSFVTLANETTYDNFRELLNRNGIEATSLKIVASKNPILHMANALNSSFGMSDDYRRFYRLTFSSNNLDYDCYGSIKNNGETETQVEIQGCSIRSIEGKPLFESIDIRK